MLLRKWYFIASDTLTHKPYKIVAWSISLNNKLNLRRDEKICKFFSYLTATRTDDEFLSSSLIFEKIFVLLFLLFADVCLDDFCLPPFRHFHIHSTTDVCDGVEFQELKAKMKFKYLMSFMLLFLSKQKRRKST